MSSVPVPVRRFIDATIDSVPELECLLLLYRSKDQSWTIDELSGRLYLPPEITSTIVANLERKRLIKSLQEAGVARHQYCPETVELRDAAIQLEQAYRAHLMLVTQLIHSKAPRAVLEFARAFRVSKDNK